MGKETDIQWCDHTFNAVEGCEKVSAGCKHCYAEARNDRFHAGENWGPGSPRLLRSPSYWLGPKKWNREAEKAGVRRRVFAGSLCDVCEDHPDWVEPRKRLAGIVLETEWLDWLFVTKRPENYRRLWDPFFGDAWPRNVWAGCTVENQEMANVRIPELLRVPAAVRFLSMEPLLGPVDLDEWICPTALGRGMAHRETREARGEPGHEAAYRVGGDIKEAWACETCDIRDTGGKGIHLAIVGGESGPKARPFDLAWMRSLRDQCGEAGVAFFPKQIGANAWEDKIALSNGTFHPVPTRRVMYGDPHGGNEEEWPFDLRGLRAFPTPAAEPRT